METEEFLYEKFISTLSIKQLSSCNFSSITIYFFHGLTIHNLPCFLLPVVLNKLFVVYYIIHLKLMALTHTLKLNHCVFYFVDKMLSSLV